MAAKVRIELVDQLGRRVQVARRIERDDGGLPLDGRAVGKQRCLSIRGHGTASFLCIVSTVSCFCFRLQQFFANSHMAFPFLALISCI